MYKRIYKGPSAAERNTQNTNEGAKTKKDKQNSSICNAGGYKSMQPKP